MRFFYLDPGLRNELGHHAQACEAITEALKARGIKPRVYAYEQVIRKVRRKLGARAHFRCWTYGEYGRDPVIGALTSFEVSWKRTVEDLDRLGPMSARDVVYVNSLLPPQLMALVHWAGALPPSRRPHIFAELGLPLAAPKPIPVNAAHSAWEPVLWRRAIADFRPELARRFHLLTFDEDCSKAYADFLRVRVATLPMPRDAIIARRNRSAADPVTVALMGHQRPNKGYDLVPAFLRKLLAARKNIRVLVHNGDPDSMRDVQNEMRRLAKRNRRLVLDERVADLAIWKTLLDRSDVIVCPYDPAHFASGYSSVMVEAIANAIPVVIPAKTPMASLLRRLGGPGTVIKSFDADATFKAVISAVDDFPRIARRALAASEQWARTQGAEKTVDSMLKLAFKGRRAIMRQTGSYGWARLKPAIRTLKHRLLRQAGLT